MLASEFDHIDVIGSEVLGLNATSALYRGRFSRHPAADEQKSAASQ
jgi:hypothetical protein